MMTGQSEVPQRIEDRCDKCGTIQIRFDPPLEFEVDDEILRDEVWAVFGEHVLIEGTFQYVDSLFYTETSAREEAQRQGGGATYGKVSIRL